LNALDQLKQHAEHVPLHICVDLASAPDGLKRVTGVKQPQGARSLFENALTTDADKVAPWLVPCPTAVSSAWLSRSLLLAQDTPAVTWIFGSLSTAEIQERMTRRLDVELSDGSEFMLRYFDPRVLSELDEVLVDHQRAHFFSFAERWCYLNRDAELCEISVTTTQASEFFVSPFRPDQSVEAALALATEAGQVLAETLKRWPDDLLRRTPQARFDLAKASCQEAVLGNADNLADKVLLLMHAADQADGYLKTPTWLAHRNQIVVGTLQISSLINVSGDYA
jgi:hypothetical protein